MVVYMMWLQFLDNTRCDYMIMMWYILWLIRWEISYLFSFQVIIIIYSKWLSSTSLRKWLWFAWCLLSLLEKMTVLEPALMCSPRVKKKRRPPWSIGSNRADASSAPIPNPICNPPPLSPPPSLFFFWGERQQEICRNLIRKGKQYKASSVQKKLKEKQYNNTRHETIKFNGA